MSNNAQETIHLSFNGESFMNPMQIDYFRKKLQNWRKQLLEECNQTINQMQDNRSVA
jgi:hypothetical protein